MVCLDGEIVPDIEPLPITAPTPRSNLNYGAGPFTHSPRTIKGEIASLEVDPEEQGLTIYTITDVYGRKHHVRSSDSPDLTDDGGNQRFSIGNKVMVKFNETDLNKLGDTTKITAAGSLFPISFDEKEELGRALFCDDRLSKLDNYGCATCHLPNHGFADTEPTSLGTDGNHGTRNTPTLYNIAYMRPLFWDGRAGSLEEQAFHPILNPIEMDMTGRKLVEKLRDVRELNFLQLPSRSVILLGLRKIKKKNLQAATVKTFDLSTEPGWENVQFPDDPDFIIGPKEDPLSFKLRDLSINQGAMITKLIEAEGERSGILVGDVILNIEGAKNIGTAEEYQEHVSNLPNDGDVRIAILRHPPLLTRAILKTLTVQTLGKTEVTAQKLPSRTAGVLITDMTIENDRTLAEAIGLRRGDIIQRINDSSINTAEEFLKEVEQATADDTFVLKVLRKGKFYSADFKEVFGGEITFQAVAEALSAFQRTITLNNTVFDRYISGLNPQEFGDAEKRGYDLFRNQARCILCHNGPNFTDGRFHNVGYPEDDTHSYAINDRMDLGRYLVTRKTTDKGAFRTPTLRGLSETFPYMHDGQVPKKGGANNAEKVQNGLEEVVAFFNHGGGQGVPNSDPLMKRLDLSDDQQKDLVAFLKTLSSPSGKTGPSVCPALTPKEN
jgi:cytochrome c peroxidase/S1-C subfamily serine protease